MNEILNNFLIEDYSPMKSRPFFHGDKLKLVVVSYCIWVLISIILAYLQPHKYASYFTDLPNDIRNISPFVLSFAYLTLFIPAVILMVLFALYILFFAIRSIYKN